MAKKKKQRKYKMPLWVDIIFTIASFIYLKLFYKVKHNRSVLRKQKDGCLLMYTHYSNKDHYFIKAASGFRRITYVLASSFFLNKTLNRILTWAHAISKDQFKPDLSSIRHMKNALDLNQIVAIAPAGQTSIDGNSPFISRTVVKFVKMCKVDVLALQTRGVYLTFPKWRRSKRKCKMQTEFKKVIAKEEIPSLTDDEIYQRIKDALDVREFEDQLTMKRKIKSKNIIAGLEEVIVKCPTCGMLHSFKLEGTNLVCDKCGLKISMDEYGLLHFSDPNIKFKMLPAFYDWQRSEFGKMYQEGMVFKSEATLFSNLNNAHQFDEITKGIVTLDQNELSFISNDQDFKEYHFNHKTIMQLPFDPGRRFEIPNEECIFRLYPINSKEVMDFVLVIDYLNNEREKYEHHS